MLGPEAMPVPVDDQRLRAEKGGASHMAVLFHGSSLDLSWLATTFHSMERRRELELALWRSACRHIDIAESLPDLTEAIRTAVPIDSMWIFAVDGLRVTLVAGNPVGPRARRYTVAGEDAQRAARFAAKGGVSLVNPAHTAPR